MNTVHLLIRGSATCTSSTKGDLYEYSAQDNGAIIGATAVVDPSIVRRAYPNTIRANDAVRTVSFDTTKLRAFLKENAPNIEAALLHLMYVDSIGGLRRDRKIAATLDRVIALLLAKCRKQSVTPAEKRVIQDLMKKAISRTSSFTPCSKREPAGRNRSGRVVRNTQIPKRAAESPRYLEGNDSNNPNQEYIGVSA